MWHDYMLLINEEITRLMINSEHSSFIWIEIWDNTKMKKYHEINDG